MKERSSTTSDAALMVIGLCIIVAPVADILFVILFFFHNEEMNYLEPVP